MGYVIHKASREPTNVSYSGNTWDKAGVRGYYKESYEDIVHAELLARILSKHNSVEFKVYEIN